MLIILCEDEGCGKDFWIALNKSCLGNKAFVYSAKGNKNFQNALLDLYKQGYLIYSNNILIALDNINTAESNDVIRYVRKLKSLYNFQYLITGYYSIEEALMSYSYFPKITDLQNRHSKDGRYCLLDIYNFIKPYLVNNGRTYEYDNRVRDYINSDGGSYNTREKAAKALCTNFTKGTPFVFRKNKLSDCWYNNCFSVSELRQRACIGNKCYYSVNDMRMSDSSKMSFLWHNSLLEVFVCPLSQLQQLL